MKIIRMIFYLYLNLGLDHYQIDLLGNVFRARLQNKNKILASLIYSNPGYLYLRKLIEFRDIVQYRHIIKSMRIQIAINGPYKIVIPKDPEFLVAQSAMVYGTPDENIISAQ